MNASRSQRDNSANEAARQSNRLAQADRDLNRAANEKSAAASALAEKMGVRNDLLVDLGKLQSRNDALRLQQQTLARDLATVDAELQVLAQTLVTYQQNKWVNNLGLEKLDENVLSPARNRVPRLGVEITSQSDRITRIAGKITDTSNRLSSLR